LFVSKAGANVQSFSFRASPFSLRLEIFPMKFLIVQTAFIGDVVLATPLVEKLRRFFPTAEIDFLLRKGNEKLLAGHPYIRKTMIWDKKKDKYRSLLRLIRDVRQERYDWVINCQRFGASGLLTAFSGAKHSSGFDKNPFAFLFSRKVPHQFGSKERPIHEVERNLKLIEHLTDNSFERPCLYPSESDNAKVAQLNSSEKYVCIAPTSVWFTKQFPAHKWAELINRIPADCQIFLLGGKEDIEPCENIRNMVEHPSIQNLAGKLSFLESAALMKNAAMNYANDSAPIHIASAVNAPMTAIFCSTIPAFGFTPLSDQSFVVETNEQLKCRPCGLHGKKACPLGHFACAESINVEKICIP